MNKVICVRPLQDGKVFVEMADGRVGEFDVKPFMESSFLTHCGMKATLIRCVWFSVVSSGQMVRILAPIRLLPRWLRSCVHNDESTRMGNSRWVIPENQARATVSAVPPATTFTFGNSVPLNA